MMKMKKYKISTSYLLTCLISIAIVNIAGSQPTISGNDSLTEFELYIQLFDEDRDIIDSDTTYSILAWSGCGDLTGRKNNHPLLDTTRFGVRYFYSDVKEKCLTVTKTWSNDNGRAENQIMQIQLIYSREIKNVTVFIDSIQFDAYADIVIELDRNGNKNCVSKKYSDFEHKIPGFDDAPTPFDVWVNNGDFEFSKKNYVKALECYTIALKMAPDEVWLKKQIDYCNLLLDY
jgi:tetratricopeptide (TPR) repeat protein